ncbi:hypothetical protein ASG73_06470 [Janibacter sp. Soil728]|nr:hypothetical protein ASG73_06470 [Janibacter sp. Soil728]
MTRGYDDRVSSEASNDAEFPGVGCTKATEPVVVPASHKRRPHQAVRWRPIHDSCEGVLVVAVDTHRDAAQPRLAPLTA